MDAPLSNQPRVTPAKISLRSALLRALRTDAGVTSFALDHVPTAVQRFKPDMDLASKIDEILAVSDQQQLLEVLQLHYRDALNEPVASTFSEPSNATIRQMLDGMLPAASDFDAFMLDFFPDIMRRFSASMNRVEKSNLALSSIENKWVIISALQKFDPERFAKRGYTIPPQNAPTEGAFLQEGEPSRIRFYDESLPSSQQAGLLRGALNDQIANEDHLGFGSYVHAFADLIESHHTSTPLTIGIFGTWGSGKSFLLQHITKELEARRENRTKSKSATTARVHVVQFNAWEYTALSSIWPGLIRKTMQHLEKNLSWGWSGRFLGKFFYNARKQWDNHRPAIISLLLLAMLLSGLSAYLLARSELTKLAWPGMLALFGAVASFVSSVFEPIKKTIGEMGDKVEKAASYLYAQSQKQGYGGYTDTMEEIREDLDFLAQRLERSNDRILITIDDLDRCEPQKAVEVLQAINLLLNFDRFIICLGIDARIITRAVEAHYKNLLGPAGALGYEYLDKMIQIPFRIPSPSHADIQKYLSRILSDEGNATRISEVTGTAAPVSQAASRVDAVQADKAHDRSATVNSVTKQQSNPLPVNSSAYQAFSEHEMLAFQTLARFLRPNPRHLKRLVNVYRLVRILAEYNKEEFVLLNPYITIRWLMICSQWPYTVGAMLYYYDELQERKERGIHIELRPGDVLAQMFAFVRPHLQRARQNSLDHDPDLLAMLLTQSTKPMTWEQLAILKKYTVNFNPAIESEGLAEIPILLLRQPQSIDANSAPAATD